MRMRRSGVGKGTALVAGMIRLVGAALSTRLQRPPTLSVIRIKPGGSKPNGLEARRPLPALFNAARLLSQEHEDLLPRARQSAGAGTQIQTAHHRRRIGSTDTARPGAGAARS